MIQVKGKFITLAASLMNLYKEAVNAVDQELFNDTGKHWNELEPEAWYNVKHYAGFMTAYVNASPSGENALLTLGKQIYPFIKNTAGFPPHLKTPLDYIEFENEGYQANLKGPGIEPRKITQLRDGYVVVQTKMIEQNCRILEGVYMGIMKMAGVNRGKIVQQKCLTKGDDYCEFHIIWKPGKSAP